MAVSCSSLLCCTFHSLRNFKQVITICIITKEFDPIWLMNLTLTKYGLFLVYNVKTKSWAFLKRTLKFNLPLI